MIYLAGEVTAQMYLDIAKRLDKRPYKISVCMNSEGGDLLSALAIYDRLVIVKDCTITATGECSSAATIIMQAAKLRRATPHTQFYVHLCQLDTSKVQDPNPAEGLQMKVHLDQVIFKIMSYRMTPAAIREAISRKVFDAVVAKRLGMIDEIWHGN